MNLSGIEIGFLISAIFVILYVLVIVYFIFGWAGNKKFIVQNKNSATAVSIIIAARNEEENIGDCLRSVFTQDLSASCLEVIVVNDHSDDRTKEIISPFKNGNLKYLDLSVNETGKKAAITKGIQHASNELIVLTDADCIIRPACMTTVISFFETNESSMILFPVLIKEDSSFFSKIQALESLSLLAVTASSANLNFPLLANGAGIAYPKKIVMELNGFAGNMHFPGGDDMMMLEKMKQRDKKIQFLFAREALVETLPAKGLNAFFDQRIRWASKTKHYSDKRTKLLALLVYLASFSLVFTGISGLLLLNIRLLFWAISLLIFKAVFDFLFLFLAAKSFNRLRLMAWFLPVLLFYPFYVLLIGVLSMFSRYTWKGRVYKV